MSGLSRDNSLHRHVVVLLLVAAAAGCRSTQTTAPRAATPPGSSVSATPAVPDSIRWFRTSAEYVGIVLETYRAATVRVDAASANLPAGRWAVVLDADETVLDNSQYQLERAQANAGYSEESWAAWVKRRAATPLPGVAAFLTRVHERGGRIAIVTNRLQSVCADTEAVFTKYALAHDTILCRVDGTPSDKNPRFRAVAEGRSPLGTTPLTIVAYVGDNIFDFPGLSQSVRTQGDAAYAQFGVQYFLLPNPMYGSWQ